MHVDRTALWHQLSEPHLKLDPTQFRRLVVSAYTLALGGILKHIVKAIDDLLLHCLVFEYSCQTRCVLVVLLHVGWSS